MNLYFPDSDISSGPSGIFSNFSSGFTRLSDPEMVGWVYPRAHTRDIVVEFLKRNPQFRADPVIRLLSVGGMRVSDMAGNRIEYFALVETNALHVQMDLARKLTDSKGLLSFDRDEELAVCFCLCLNKLLILYLLLRFQVLRFGDPIGYFLLRSIT